MRDIRDLKNAYGGRCWVVGNGPSLARMPLDRLLGEYSLACNNIATLWDGKADATTWRPTFYYNVAKQTETRPDWLAWARKATEVIPIAFLRTTMPIPDTPFTYRIPLVYYTKARVRYGRRVPVAAWSEDPSWGLFHYRMTLYSAAQLLCYLGFKKLYFIGCDLGFTVQGGHFDPRYEGTYVFSPGHAFHVNMWQGIAHRWIRYWTQQYGVETHNAGIGGDLNAYPRMDFRKALRHDGGYPGPAD